MIRLLQKWGNSRRRYYGGGVLFFIVASVIAFRIFIIIVLMMPWVSSVAYHIILSDIRVTLGLWFLCYILLNLRGGMEPTNMFGDKFEHSTRAIINQFVFFSPLLMHMALSCFCRVFRFSCVPWGVYEEVVKYATENPRRIPLEEIGADGEEEFDRYIQPLIDLEVIQLLEGDPIGITLTAKFREFCFKEVSAEPGCGR